ncbi:MAG: lysophospholipid acyltransferase family protein [Acidobacteriaceae bacterium]|nr:lysophospholipid acyltransferase family protein [Acidobacteriaceae bacterium]
MSPNYTFKQRAALATIPTVAALAIRLLGATLRFEDTCEPGAVAGYDVPPPGVYAFWHRCLIACAARFRDAGIHILISRSFDGELVARTVEKLGFYAARGSSSRDGASGLREMLAAYEAGYYCAVTSDGPRGPAQIVKPGVVHLAQLAGARVGAFYLHPQRAWELRSWDRFLIPKPFSRVIVGWSAPARAERSEVQSALDRAVRIAETTERGKNMLHKRPKYVRKNRKK